MNDDGGPVFPGSDFTLRDWFAGQALAGKCGYSAEQDVRIDVLTMDAYRIADAMLAARKEVA